MRNKEVVKLMAILLEIAENNYEVSS